MQLQVDPWTKHIDIKTYECKLCEGKIFKAAENLNRHVRIKHEGWRLSCNECDFETTTKNGLEIHSIKHHNSKSNRVPIRCEYCPKEFFLPSILSYHMRQHTGYKPHKCSICEKAFSIPNNKRKHEKIHNLVRLRPFSCTQCNSKFTDSHHLKRHFEGKHLKIKHKCGKCDKEYQDTRDLQKHEVIKHGPLLKDQGVPSCGL